jgi:hypothetical protein
MATGTDDDDIIGGLRRGIAPLARPALLSVKSLRYKARKREAPHAPITSTVGSSIGGERHDVTDAVDVVIV